MLSETFPPNFSHLLLGEGAMMSRLAAQRPGTPELSPASQAGLRSLVV